MKFYNAWYCPFAQRVWMALVYKGIDFEYIEVDPYHPSDWWIKVSRGAGLVPVIVQGNSNGKGETTVVESNRILEYLEDLNPEDNPIFALDPLKCAEQKYWMDHIGTKITPSLYQFLKAVEPGAGRDESRDKMIEGLTAWVSAMDESGPYFSGASLSAVDIAMIPFAYRIDVLLAKYRDFSLAQDGDNWQRYYRWYRQMLDHPAFGETAFEQPEYQQRLIEHYLPYSCGDGQTDVARVN